MSSAEASMPFEGARSFAPSAALLAKLLLLVLLASKLLLTGWNAYAFDNKQYDDPHHVWRAKTGGLEVAKMAYNPPLYYLPALAVKPAEGEGKASGAALLKVLRHTNVFWLGLFYACWIFVIFPRVLPDWRTAFVASALLLALPGYQKLGLMAHPDNALAALVALLVAAWLVLRERIQSGERNWGAVIALALCTGAVGLTRPFSIVPVGLFWLVMMVELLRGHPLPAQFRAFAARALVATVIAGVIAGSWHVYRWSAASAVTDAYDDRYMSRYIPHRADFSFLPYFASFHLGALIDVPNRQINKLDKQNPWPKNRYANSFFTTLYSETWGDHWLYVSGPVGRDGKIHAKRAIFLLALPLTPLLFWRFGRGAWQAARSLRGEWTAPPAVLLALFVLCVGLYLYWQTGPALLPGKNSTIKFIYNAHIYPMALAICFLAPVRQAFAPWAAYALVLAGAALPVAIFWPAG